MPEINKKKRNQRWPLWILIFPLVDFVLLMRYLIQGKNVALFNPQGYIAGKQHNLMLFVVTVLLGIAIPTMCILFYIAWKYRDTGEHAIQNPVANRSNTLILKLWLIPTSVMLIIVSVMWPATHVLAPREAITADTKPITIQVIAVRWKWLFLYPDQKIATVNFVQMPVNTPVKFELTADEVPMSSFWIPNLGGQLYAMTGHINPLNLMATNSGEYPGSSAEINGAGFAGMRFIARASSVADFDSWVKGVKQSPHVLDAATYEKLVQPSENNPATYYSNYDSGLYAKVVMKYVGPSGEHTH